MPMSQVMTVPELAQFLRVHPATIYRLLRDGRIPGFRVGAEWRFDREAIERWQQQREVKHMTPEERSEAAAKSGRSQWERLTPEQRSAEMKRRAAMRKKKT